MNKKFIVEIFRVLKGASFLMALLGTLYVFHKKIIISDLETLFITRSEANEVSLSRIEGAVLQTQIIGMRDDLTEIKSDIKQILRTKK